MSRVESGKCRLGLLLAVGLGLASEAQANVVIDYPVKIDLDYRTAQGALGTARDSGDTEENIGCFGSASGGYFCMARGKTSSGQYATVLCDAKYVYTMLESVNMLSHVFFRWNSEGVCTEFQVYTASNFRMPKT